MKEHTVHMSGVEVESPDLIEVTVEAHPDGRTLIIRRYVAGRVVLSKTVEVAL